MVSPLVCGLLLLYKSFVAATEETFYIKCDLSVGFFNLNAEKIF